MKEIPRLHGLTVIVDDEDYEWAKNVTWEIRKDFNTHYAYRTERDSHRRRRIPIHHDILGPPPHGMMTA